MSYLHDCMQVTVGYKLSSVDKLTCISLLNKCNYAILFWWEAWWPNGYYTCLQMVTLFRFEPAQGETLGKTLYSHSLSLHPGLSMGTGKLNVEDNPATD